MSIDPRLRAATLALLALPVAVQAQDAFRPDWRAPLHRAEDTDGRVRHWAAGPDYKVAFDDGVTFFPVLGADAPRNLPLRWRTETIALAGRAHRVDDAAATADVSAWRYALRHGPVVEVYDVRDDGVEQSFVLDADAWHGAAPGQDLWITGRIETDLEAPAVPAGQQEIVFRDDRGRPVVRYGKAIAFDAAGRETAVETSFDGARIALRVDGAWLSAAAWPVTVDPLLARAAAGGNGSDPTSYPAVARNDVQNRLMVTYSRATSGGDYDLYVHVRDDAFGALALVYTDVTTASTRHSAAAWVRGANRFVVAFQRQTALASDIRVYFHAGGDLGSNTGTLRTLPNGILGQDSEPALASTDSGTSAYLVFRSDTSGSGPANTRNSEVRGVLVDAVAGSVGTIRDLHTSATADYDAEAPSVSGSSDGDGWMVVWQEFNYANSGDDWDIIGQRIAPDGNLLGEVVLGRSSTSSRHKVAPFVAGGDGRYLLAYAESPNTGNQFVSGSGDRIAVQRFDWPLGGTATRGPVRDVASSPTLSFALGLTNRPIAFDHETRSHWALAWMTASDPLHIARIGFDGRVAESALLQAAEGSSAFYSPSLCFDDDARQFVAVYAADLAPGNSLVYGRRFAYSPQAAASAYGVSCGGIASTSNPGATGNRPYAGSENFAVRLTSARPSTPVWLLAGFGTANVPLPGAPGCNLLLDPALPVLTVAVGVTDAAGAFSQPFALPSTVRGAQVYWQFVQWDGVLSSSRGLSTFID